jgi:guanylate kinase
MNKVFVISGNSGSGKDTIMRAFLKERKDFVRLVTTTTREKRKEDIDGVTYNFISKKDFEELIKKDEIIEYNFHFGNYYGSRKEDVQKLLDAKKNILIQVEVKGAMTFKEKIENAILIFIKAPSLEVLKERIIKRETINDEELNSRIKRAEEELSYENKYDYSVVNDDLEEAIKEFTKIIDNELGK